MAETIKLTVRKEEHEDYLRFVFGSPRRGPITIDRSKDIGKYISSRVRYADTPQSLKGGKEEFILELILPERGLRTAASHYVHFTQEDVDKINDYLTAEFNQFFRAYMLAGEEINIEYKDLIEAFMLGIGIRNPGTKFDTLKKKDYRHRDKIHKIVLESLQRIGYQ